MKPFTAILIQLGAEIVTINGNWYCQWSFQDANMGMTWANDENGNAGAEESAQLLLVSLLSHNASDIRYEESVIREHDEMMMWLAD